MKGFLLSLAVFLLVMTALVIHVLTAPPIPLSLTVGTITAGSMTLSVRSVAPFRRNDPVIVDADTNVAMTLVTGVDASSKSLTLSEPITFEIPEDSPATVALRAVATPVAIFDGQVALRRFPSEDSRVFAYSRPGMWKEVMRLSGDWVKTAIRPPVEGWTLASEATIVEGEIASRASFRRQVPVRRYPHKDEALVRWEGRIVTKDVIQTPEGEKRYLLTAESFARERRVLQVPKTAWQNLLETEYIVERQGIGISEMGPPLAFTTIGPPYEIVGREGDWLKIQIQDQGWVKRDACKLAVRYNYSLTRRQMLNRWIRRLVGVN